MPRNRYLTTRKLVPRLWQYNITYIRDSKQSETIVSLYLYRRAAIHDAGLQHNFGITQLLFKRGQSHHR